jgi:hypothetical protein
MSDMSNAAGAFAYNWVGQNISADVYAPEGDTSQAEALVSRMLVDAVEAGISRGEMESAVGDLMSFISNAMENATDEEVGRLSEEDD